MGTHSLTIELSDTAYQSLKQKIDSGRYATVDEAIEEALLDVDLPSELQSPVAGQSYEEWLRAEAIAAYDEHAANPHEIFTSQEVLAYLAEERSRDSSA
jgi:hypothetical protein